MLKLELMIQKLIQKFNTKYNYINTSKINTTPVVKIKNISKKRNRDNLLIGSVLFGRYKLKPYTCKVYSNKYVIAEKKYSSLSEAACAVTGEHTDGWKFWKIEDFGLSVLETFRQSTEKI